MKNAQIKKNNQKDYEQFVDSLREALIEAYSDIIPRSMSEKWFRPESVDAS